MDALLLHWRHATDSQPWGFYGLVVHALPAAMPPRRREMKRTRAVSWPPSKARILIIVPPKIGTLEGVVLGQSTSALGQKQTYALHKGMSALPPIATAK